MPSVQKMLSFQQVRSFVSIDLDDSQILSEVGRVIASFQALGGDLKPVERENIHITLKFLGNMEKARLDQIKTALDSVKFDAFPLEVRGAGAFPNLRRINVIWVGLGEGWSKVQLIYEQTESLISRLGFPRESRTFSPHVTIARVKSPRRQDEIAQLVTSLRDRDFGAFNVERVRLKQSILSPQGPRYSTLHEVSPQTR